MRQNRHRLLAIAKFNRQVNHKWCPVKGGPMVTKSRVQQIPMVTKRLSLTENICTKSPDCKG